jgi:hypothetical protein
LILHLLILMSDEFISLIITNKLKHLLNNAYQEFKRRYPCEEPAWNIRCMRRKPYINRSFISRSDMVDNWRVNILERGKSDDNKFMMNDDKKQTSTISGMKLIPSKTLITTRVVKRSEVGLKNRIVSKPPEIKHIIERTVTNDVQLNPELDQITVDMDVSLPCAPVVTMVNSQFNTIQSCELYGVSMDRTVITSRNLSFENGKKLVESLREIMRECDEITKDLSLNDEKLNTQLKRNVDRLTESNFKLQTEIKMIKEEYYSRDQLIIDEKIDPKLLTRVETLLGHKPVIGELIAKFVSIEDKLNLCKSSITNTLKSTNLDYKSMYKEHGFLGSLPHIIKEILSK